MIYQIISNILILFDSMHFNNINSVLIKVLQIIKNTISDIIFASLFVTLVAPTHKSL